MWNGKGEFVAQIMFAGVQHKSHTVFAGKGLGGRFSGLFFDLKITLDLKIFSGKEFLDIWYVN